MNFVIRGKQLPSKYSLSIVKLSFSELNSDKSLMFRRNSEYFLKLESCISKTPVIIVEFYNGKKSF